MIILLIIELSYFTRMDLVSVNNFYQKKKKSKIKSISSNIQLNENFKSPKKLKKNLTNLSSKSLYNVLI